MLWSWPPGLAAAPMEKQKTVLGAVLGKISTQGSRSGLRVSKPQANGVEDQATFVSSLASPSHGAWL